MKNERWVWFTGLALAGAACSTGLGNFFLGGTGVEPTGTGSFSEVGLGFDPGFALTLDPQVAVTGALVPGATAMENRRIAFFAFSSDLPADDADGAGTALARDAVTPIDTNGASDVFLAALVSTDVEVDGEPLPTAFSQGMVNVFRHSRCVNCHAMGHEVDGAPVFNELTPHPGPTQPVPNVEGCSDCHTPLVFGDDLPWVAPLQDDGDDLGDFDFRSRTVEELNARALQDPTGRSFKPFSVIDPEGAVEHLKSSPQVNWAITRGVVPTAGMTGPTDMGVPGGSSANTTSKDVGPVPLSRDEFDDLVDAWALGGYRATTERSVRDITLVSRAAGGGPPMAADGASTQPSITYVANPAHDPNAPDAEVPVGWVYTAFSSDAADLVAGGSAAFRDVYRATVAVHLDTIVDPVDPSMAELVVDLRVVDGDTEILSASVPGPALGGNGDSDQPAISADGAFVAFRSAATDLIGGFIDGAGGTDVFLRDVEGGVTDLASHRAGNALRGGDGASSWPHMSQAGHVVSYQSEAEDLVTDDTNGVQDVFYARHRTGGFDPIARASVASGGAQASGGASGAATVYFLGDETETDVFIAYESAKTDLVAVAGLPADNVYLFDSRGAGTTYLLSQSMGGMAADGPSSAPWISPNGDAVIFQTSASNLDGARGTDSNACSDVVLVDLATLFATDTVQARRLSVSFLGEDGDGHSTSPQFGAFQADGAFDEGLFVGYATEATNLGASANNPHLISFLETIGFPTIAAFDADVVEGIAPLLVNFEDRSLGGATAWSWNFGDRTPADLTPANTSTDQDPAHTYADPGTYTVSLTVTGDTGDDTEDKVDFVTVHPPTVPDFAACNDPAFTDCPPQVMQAYPTIPVYFQDLTAGDPQSWSWDFDTSDGIQVDSTAQNPVHMYTDPGTYSVQLTATGPFGGEGPQSITKAMIVDVDMTDDPIASFTTETSVSQLFPKVCEDEVITFTSTTRGDILSLRWEIEGQPDINLNLGDCGGDFSNCAITHTFNTPGDYDVTLTAFGPSGSTSSTRTVEVARDVAFSEIQTILNDDNLAGAGTNSCVSCHSTFDDSNGSGLINVAASLGSCPGETLVIRGDPDNSLLYKKITSPPCGSMMPTVGNNLAGSQVAAIRDWIICIQL